MLEDLLRVNTSLETKVSEAVGFNVSKDNILYINGTKSTEAFSVYDSSDYVENIGITHVNGESDTSVIVLDTRTLNDCGLKNNSQYVGGNNIVPYHINVYGDFDSIHKNYLCYVITDPDTMVALYAHPKRYNINEEITVASALNKIYSTGVQEAGEISFTNEIKRRGNTNNFYNINTDLTRTALSSYVSADFKNYVKSFDSSIIYRKKYTVDTTELYHISFNLYQTTGTGVNKIDVTKTDVSSSYTVNFSLDSTDISNIGYTAEDASTVISLDGSTFKVTNEDNGNLNVEFSGVPKNTVATVSYTNTDETERDESWKFNMWRRAFVDSSGDTSVSYVTSMDTSFLVTSDVSMGIMMYQYSTFSKYLEDKKYLSLYFPNYATDNINKDYILVRNGGVVAMEITDQTCAVEVVSETTASSNTYHRQNLSKVRSGGLIDGSYIKFITTDASLTDTSIYKTKCFEYNYKPITYKYISIDSSISSNLDSSYGHPIKMFPGQCLYIKSGKVLDTSSNLKAINISVVNEMQNFRKGNMGYGDSSVTISFHKDLCGIGVSTDTWYKLVENENIKGFPSRDSSVYGLQIIN